MSQERAKMQQTFQNDRKKMKNDFDQEILKVQNERDKFEKQKNQFDEELKEIKNVMKEQVRSMETENTASKIANRELQKQLNSERLLTPRLSEFEILNDTTLIFHNWSVSRLFTSTFFNKIFVFWQET